MGEAVRAVVFDIGGVLLEWDPRLVYGELVADSGELAWFLSEVCTPEWNSTLDAGLPFDVACAELVARYPAYTALVEAWRRQDDMIAGEITGTAALVGALRDLGMPLYLLTNMPADVYAARRRRYAVLRQFDGAVVSGEEGVLKPSAEIFARLVARFDLVPAETLFVDDAQANVRGAEAAGLRAHRFVGAPALAAWLRSQGLDV